MTAGGERKALIVGAGIGGLTAAIALERAGIEAVVFDRMDPLRPLGAGFTLAPNALRAFRRLGIADAVLAVSEPLQYYEHRSRRGRLLRRWPSAEWAGELGEHVVAISRPELHRALLDGLGSARLAEGKQCTGVDQDPSGVTASFTDGSEERGDLLVGADGAHSTIRRLFDPTDLDYVGYTGYLGVTGAHSINHATHTQSYGNQAVFGMMPLRDGRTYWYASRTAPRTPLEEPEERKAIARRIVDGWYDPIESLVESTDAEAIARLEIFDLPPRSSWGSGRVTLLGDAAHPMSPAIGQGAGQAIEDAMALARHVSANGDVAASISAYEAERIARTDPVVKMARKQGHLIQGDTPPIRAARAAMLRGAPLGKVKQRWQSMVDVAYPGH